jgi:deoxyribodipyrimidine photolyase-related protein
MKRRPRRLVLVLGDQLSETAPALAGFDPAADSVLMIEARGEATHVESHRARIVLFLAAMRHFAASLRSRGWGVVYLALDDPGYPETTLAGRLARVLEASRPAELRLTEAGEWRLQQDIRATAERAGVELTVCEDTHFICSRSAFAQWAGARRSLRLEHFYRFMRRREGVLIEADGAPAGGAWNFDADNRAAFPKTGPGTIPRLPQWPADACTQDVIGTVERHFPAHPGALEEFAWPVTRAQALVALERFMEERLPSFGRFQDAMWTDEPYGWHSLLSTSLNLKLLDPREVIFAAERAWREGRASIASVEGFVRQILGWREFVRGVYWLDMPALAQANHYGHERPLPRWYWTGETRMACMRAVVGQTLRTGYAHHIQRLMVTGQFALLAGIAPRAVCDWYLAMYVDAVEWVELPNTAGMALHAAGARMTSKPYIASGAYIQRQSNYCRGCDYAPGERSGARACPVTALYWNFLDRHEKELARNPRTRLMAASVARLAPAQRTAVRAEAARMLDNLDDL